MCIKSQDTLKWFIHNYCLIIAQLSNNNCDAIDRSFSHFFILYAQAIGRIVVLL